MLNSLDSFLKRTEPGIEAITGEESDVTSFMRLMRIFNEVRNKMILHRNYSPLFLFCVRSANIEHRNCVQTPYSIFFYFLIKKTKGVSFRFLIGKSHTNRKYKGYIRFDCLASSSILDPVKNFVG